MLVQILEQQAGEEGAGGRCAGAVIKNQEENDKCHMAVSEMEMEMHLQNYKLYKK